jgi:AcrR family transcriptional regulator
MASPAPARSSPLQPHDWLRAASRRLASDGVDFVRIELLARDLGVSKGSFYWHFRDREDLLAKLLGQWEREEADWLDAPVAGIHSAASRWARFVNRCAAPDRLRLEAAIRSWARKNARVASRVKAIESRRGSYLEGILRETGFSPFAAAQWADLALFVYLGWLDRITRDADFQHAGTPLAELLSHMILAASSKSHSSAS